MTPANHRPPTPRPAQNPVSTRASELTRSWGEPRSNLAYRDDMTRLFAAMLALVLIPGAACSSAAEPDESTAAQASGQTSSGSASTSTEPSTAASSTLATAGQRTVKLKVTRVAKGLDHPWDVHPIGHGRLLVTERSGSLTVIEKR